MGIRKVYLVFFFTLMCLVLYFVNYNLNSNISNDFLQYHVKYGKTEHILAKNSNNFLEIKDACEDTFEPLRIPQSSTSNWQKLNNASTLFLLSAYRDNRLATEHFIRIIAMSKGQFSQRILCRVWYDGKKSSVTEIEAQELWVTSWDSVTPDQYYRPLLLSCPCKYQNAVAVSVLQTPCQRPNNIFWLTPADTKRRKRNFAVCLKPLNYQNDLSSRLVEWLELQFILGADTISVYKYNLHPRTEKVLKSYAEEGRLTVHQHQLPEDLEYQQKLLLERQKQHTLTDSADPKVRDTLTETDLVKIRPKLVEDSNRNATDLWQKRRHEMVIYNDCFYRHIDSHRFVVNLDLDEAIVPLRHSTWEDILHQAMVEDPRLAKSASMSAQNVYFFDAFPEDDSIPKEFHMLRHIFRSANFTPPGFAQKSFFATDLALSVTNHYALKSLRPGIRTIGGIGKDLAQLHHYREDCPPKMEKECEDNYMKYWIRDPVILKFKEKLMENVSFKLKGLKTN